MRILLVSLILQLGGSEVKAQCELPGTFSNFAVVTENDLKVTLATDKTTYVPGETVAFFFIVENTGSSTFSINWQIDPQDGIFVMPAPCTTVNQPCFDAAVYYWPTTLYFFSAGTTLAPGECRVWERSWNTTDWPAPPGTYNVLGGMCEPTFDGDIVLFHVPSTGVLLNVTIDGTVPTDGHTWGKVKALYR